MTSKQQLLIQLGGKEGPQIYIKKNKYSYLPKKNYSIILIDH
jgi:hypothetical protein